MKSFDIKKKKWWNLEDEQRIGFRRKYEMNKIVVQRELSKKLYMLDIDECKRGGNVFSAPEKQELMKSK